jgi:hypothetical protein
MAFDKLRLGGCGIAKRPNLTRVLPMRDKSGIIFNGIVIPAKAGIHLPTLDLVWCWETDSRFRGNDEECLEQG